MRPLIIILAIIFIALLIPTIVKSLNDTSKHIETEKEDDSLVFVLKPVLDDIEINVYDHKKKQVVKMNLEDYVMGAVAGEMPASFEMEALKAQAVAARTLVIYKLQKYGGRGCNQAVGADICTAYSHCQAWVDDSSKRETWGKKYESNYKKIQQAVWQTWGEIITYNGKPIEVFYYSTSNGKTEDVSEVFSNSLPYYKVVDSIGEEDAPRYHGSVSLSKKQLVNKIKQKYPNSSVTESNAEKQIWIKSHTDSGRVREIIVGGVRMTGTEFRLLFGLNSADFSLHFDNDSVTIKTKGFGHGVGMSQVGADCMAKRGNNYKEILKHYYQGVSIEKY